MNTLPPKKKIRVLIVDDSATIRMILRDLLSNYPDIEISGEACDGLEGVEKARLYNPDIVLMDIQMPVLNGFEATEQIMAHTPKPILILSSIINHSEVYTSMRAIELGALDVMEKPEFSEEKKIGEFSAKLVEKVRMLSRIHVITHIRGRQTRPREEESPRPSPSAGAMELIAVGASTGGPLALKIIFSGLPPDFDTPILVVQHITTGFLDGMAGWLQTECKRKMVVLEQNHTMEKRTVYFVPNGFQPGFSSRNVVALDERRPPVGGFKPSADALFERVAEFYGPRAVGVILTGMGDDGAKGLLKMKIAGALTIAQDRMTSIVYGMPRAAADLGAVLHVLPVDQIPTFLSHLRSGRVHP